MLDIYEKKVFSQFGEDGITDYIFTKIGTDTEYFVEIGTQDGSECEYNACLDVNVDQVIQYDPNFWDAGPYNIYHGASLKAFYNLAQSKNYSLIHSNGVNAFFVNNDYWTNDEDFPETNNLEVLWKDYPAFLGYRFMHEHPTHKHANFNTSELLLELEL